MPTAFEQAQSLLRRCARACAPYGKDVVIGGRMALLLYRSRDDFVVLTRPALATREVDAVVPRRLALRERSIPRALADEGLVPYDIPSLDRKSRGKRLFQDEQHGSERPAPEYVEFLAPRVTDADGMLEPQPALVASALRYVELLLFEPLVVELDGLAVHVAAPAMFVAQKVLMRTSPSGRREDKDLVSLFEACQLSALRWSEERKVVTRARAHDPHWKKWLARVPSLLTGLFATATSEGSVAVAVALQSQPEAPSPAAVSRIVMDATNAMFIA